ncbi:MAG: hypothetical protein LBF44_01905 [Holosporaceae bacterium]|jgi:hypothetical protein|nr:hypothetical protein [Holosporaceae bacterium]
MKARMEFAAHCAVNMIQNQGKKITRQDLGRIFSAASLVVYPGMTQYLLRSNRYTYGHFPIAYLFYVKGLGEEKATVMWMWDSGSQGTVPFSGSCRRSEAASDANFSTTRFLVRYKINAKQEDIYKDLKISKDEVKMIVYFSHRTHNGFCFFDNSAVNIYDGKKLFGFWILPPKPIEAYPSTGAGWLNYFSIALIFTPKPGLFSETSPQ